MADLKIGDEVYIHGFVDEVRKDTIIIKNEGGYFGTVIEEIMPTAQPDVPDINVGDMISRQATIDTVAKSALDLNDPDENWIMQDRIKEIPSAQPDKDALDDAYAHGYTAAESEFRKRMDAQPEPQWIPCSEQLPETKEGELKRCLLTEELHLITGETVIGVCVAFYDGEYNTWFYDLGEDMEEVNYPLAWMPLPEPYAERRTDETQNT